MSDEQRFDNAMRAIFGDYYEEPRFKETSDLSAGELIKIKNLKENGYSLPAAVKVFVGDRLPKENFSKADKKKIESALQRYVEQVKKHFKRNKGHYEEFIPVEGYADIESSPYRDASDDAQEKREKIFAALRDAGWDI